ncbi:MAG: EAL domain-containing protein [Pseudomonadota bacterium]
MATILIVDDHVLNRQFLAALLGFDNHTLLQAADGLEGLKLVETERPALVITDIMMPNMNGYEFVTRMRADPSIADTPVIFYTSTYSTREANVMARTCGVRWVLQKPASPDQILQTVHEALGLPMRVARDMRGTEITPAKRGLATIDNQLAEYLGELETSRQLMTQIAADGDHTQSSRESLQQITQRLSQSLSDLQTVSLRLTALIDMGIELTVERDPVRLLETGCKVARHISVAKYAVIGILDDAGEKLQYFAVRGLDPQVRDQLALQPPTAGILGTLLSNRAPQRLKDLGGDPQVLGLPASHPPIHSFLGVPIASSGRCYGWIYLVDKLGADAFSEVDERAAATVATQLAVAYENLALYERVQDSVAQLEGDLVERKRITDQLFESETRFRQLAENINEVFFLIDPANTQMLYISPGYEAIWGRSCESLYARPQSWMESIHPDDVPTVLGHEAARKPGNPQNNPGSFDYQYRIVRPDGELRWIHARGFPIRNAAGDVYRIAGIAADITQQTHLQASLREREAGLQRAQLMAKMAHVITDLDGAFESWSATLPLLIKVEDAAMPPTTRAWMAFIEPADRARFRDTCLTAARTGKHLEVEYRLRRGNGTVVHIHQVLEPLEGPSRPDGRLRWFNTMQDITDQKEQQLRIARLSQLYAVLSGINSAIVRIRDRDELLQEACRVAVSQGAFSMAWAGTVDPDTLDCRIVGWHGSEPPSASNLKFSARADAPEGDRPACVAVREKRQMICNDTLAEPALSPVLVELGVGGHRSVAALPLIVENQVVAVITLFADETGFFDDDELKLLNELAGDLSFGLHFISKEERLHYLAYYDALTGLPNNTLFDDRLTQFLHAAGREGLAAIVLIDLDRFAQLNDALGRHAGDMVLKMVAQRLTNALREPYSLARIGGDVFAIAFAGFQQGADAAMLLEQQVFQALSQPFTVAQHDVRLSVQAGIALYPADGNDAETLFKHAEVALKKAKSSGERFLYYAPQMNTAVAARMALESALREALDAGQFLMHYQPRVDLLSGRIVSAEALIRWQHPLRGFIPPIEFIPLAEETGLIVPIGNWVIDAVCAQQAAWKAQHVETVPVAINLSAVQFKKGDVHKVIREAVARHGLVQECIEFELTESVVMDDPEQAIRHLQELKDLGAQLSLDDFGTGYSSLAYLKRFPFDFVKIDRAFVTDITTNPDDAAITTAVIAMAHSLGLRVVAEGVETEGQLQFLRKHRCDELQGYYFSRPVEPAAFEAMLRESKRLVLAPEPAQREDTLLIVDDEANNLSALRRLLRQEGYRVLTASGGEEGLELLAVNSVQVIVSDQRMPGMTGSKFLSLAKELYPDTVRIILSGYTDLEAVTESVNQGAVYKFLTKPWDDGALREHIRDAFRQYRSRT